MMTSVQQWIGANVKRRRIAKDWSQSDLAKASGFSEAYIGVMERGQANPSLTTLDAIAGALQVPPYQLLRDPDRDVD